MDAGELISRYKEWPRRNRIILAGVLGLAYPVYIWTSDVPPLEEQLVSIQKEEGEAKAKFEKVKKEQENLPKLEQEFKFVQEQLVKAKAMLPEKVAMEDILSKTASIARETRVALREFTPAAEQDVKGDYRYAEIPVVLTIKGGFGNIMSFYDRVVHLAGNVRLRGLAFTPAIAQSTTGGASVAGRPQDLEAKVTMVFFRSTDTGDLPAKDAAGTQKSKKSKPEKASAGGGE